MFRCRDFYLELYKKTYIMGILNVTPDSFLDMGKYFSADLAFEHAYNMYCDGADIIDIGAMSTRPGAEVIGFETEIERLDKVLPRLVKELPIPLSIDTIYPETARYALENGAHIINDVGGKFNDDMANIVKSFDAAWIITHAPCKNAGDDMEYQDGVVVAIREYFNRVLEYSSSIGIPKENICLDPGFGFSKNTAQNMEILNNIDKLCIDGTALLCALSAKRFIGEITGQSLPQNRLHGTLAANIAAVYKGANMVRVHDVKAHADAFKMIDSILY